MAVRRARRIGGRTDSHGSARWADENEVAGTGLLGPAGVYVGGWLREGRTVPLRHDGPQHVLGFAPARSGKGVGWVLPTLLSWRHSVLVNDIKGENWALTAGWRQRALGSLCLKFDPTCSDGSSARYNPLLEVRIGAGGASLGRASDGDIERCHGSASARRDESGDQCEDAEQARGHAAARQRGSMDHREKGSPDRRVVPPGTWYGRPTDGAPVRPTIDPGGFGTRVPLP